MPVSIALLVFLMLVLLFRRGSSGADAEGGGWPRAILMAAAFWGALVVLISESLGFAKALTPLWAAIAWIAALLGLAWLLLSRGVWRGLRGRLRADAATIRRRDVLVLVPFAVLGTLLLVVALRSPPNSTDSLRYHMPRILHWAQNASLRHYATAYEPQLWNPPWAEFVILNLRLLLGSDRFANLVQWGSMVGSLAGVVGIASLLGATRLGKLAAAAFAFSIPMGILQATSGQTDYVTAFWLLCAAYFVVLGKGRALSGWELTSFGLAIGLGLLTKATFYIYAMPLLIWFVTSLLREAGWRIALRDSVWVGAMAILMNLAFWVRNVLLFGGPLGSGDWIRSSSNVGTSALGVSGYLSSFIKAALMNFVTPSQQFNEGLQALVAGVENNLGMAPSEYEIIWAWNHEDLAGYPLHIGLAILSVVLLALFRPARSTVWTYAFVMLTSYALVGLAISYAPYNVRFQLPFFVSWAPVFGTVLSSARLRWIAILATPLLLLVSLPWILFNSTRPLVGMQPDPKGLEIPCILGCTRMGSVFEVPETDLLFANWRVLQEPAGQIAEHIVGSGCEQVGLRLDSHDREYMIWWFLAAPESGIRIETIYTSPQLEELKDPTFKPCAIVCTICEGSTRLHGLERVVIAEEGLSLFMGDDYSPDPDA